MTRLIVVLAHLVVPRHLRGGLAAGEHLLHDERTLLVGQLRLLAGLAPLGTRRLTPDARRLADHAPAQLLISADIGPKANMRVQHVAALISVETHR